MGKFVGFLPLNLIKMHKTSFGGILGLLGLCGGLNCYRKKRSSCRSFLKCTFYARPAPGSIRRILGLFAWILACSPEGLGVRGYVGLVEY